MSARTGKTGWRSLLPLAIAAAVPGNAAAQSFTGLGFLPGAATSRAAAVSRDGMIVVGNSGVGASQRAFRWTAAGGMEDLGTLGSFSRATAASADGSVVVGVSASQPLGDAFRWTAAEGMVSIGVGRKPVAVSADGMVVAAASTGGQAYRWTAAQCWTLLAPLAGYERAEPSGMSADGATLVGSAGSWWCDPPENPIVCFMIPERAISWTDSGDATLVLPPNPPRISNATAISGDGTVIVGSRQQGSAFTLYHRTIGGAIVDLGSLPGQQDAVALAVNHDGSVVVGASLVSGAGSRAFLWSAAGLHDLNAHLPTLGVDLTGWTLTEATGLSADGRTIVGRGVNPAGLVEAWIVRLDAAPTCAADWDQDGQVNSLDISAFTTAWLNSLQTNSLDADFNQDGQVNSTDISAFITAWLATVVSGC